MTEVHVRSKAYVLVEGHGEVAAIDNLLARLSREVHFPLPWARALRWTNLPHWEAKSGGIRKAVEFARLKPDAGALLIVRDEDDHCPAKVAPVVAEQIRELAAPFPVAFVLLRPEYEVLFLPCLSRMAELGYPSGLEWDRESWEAKRDIKGWLSSKLPRGRSYKPTLDQLPMTRQIDLAQLRAANVPSFGSLERGLAYLRDHLGERGAVYPATLLAV